MSLDCDKVFNKITHGSNGKVFTQITRRSIANMWKRRHGKRITSEEVALKFADEVMSTGVSSSTDVKKTPGSGEVVSFASSEQTSNLKKMSTPGEDNSETIEDIIKTGNKAKVGNMISDLSSDNDEKEEEKEEEKGKSIEGIASGISTMSLKDSRKGRTRDRKEHDDLDDDFLFSASDPFNSLTESFRYSKQKKPLRKPAHVAKKIAQPKPAKSRSNAERFKSAAEAYIKKQSYGKKVVFLVVPSDDSLKNTYHNITSESFVRSHVARDLRPWTFETGGIIGRILKTDTGREYKFGVNKREQPFLRSMQGIKKTYIIKTTDDLKSLGSSSDEQINVKTMYLQDQGTLKS